MHGTKETEKEIMSDWDADMADEHFEVVTLEEEDLPLYINHKWKYLVSEKAYKDRLIELSRVPHGKN
jgi:hypothetical protein